MAERPKLDRWQLSLLMAAVAGVLAATIGRVPIVLSGGLTLDLALVPLLAASSVLGPFWGAGASALAFASLWTVDPLRAALVLGEVMTVGTLSRRAWVPVVADVAYWAAAGTAMAASGTLPQLLGAPPLFAGWLFSGVIGAIGAQGLGALLVEQSLERSARRRSFSRNIADAIVPISAVAVIILALGLGELYAATLRRVAAAELGDRVARLERRIADAVAGAEAHVRVLAGELAAYPRAVPALQTSLMRYHEAADLFLTMLVADHTGAVQTGSRRNADGTVTPASAAPTVADREYFRMPAATGRSFRSDAFLGRGFGADPIVAVSAPIDRDVRFAGLVEGSLDLRLLGARLAEIIPGDDWSLVIADARGQVVVATGADQPQLLSHAIATPWVREVAAGVTGPTADAAFLADQGRVDSLGWRVFARRTIVAVEEPMGQFYGAAAGWLAFCVFASLPLASRVARQVTAPLERLAADADRIGAGDTRRLGLLAADAPDEAVRLHRQLGAMLTELDRSLVELEGRVRDRTARLAAITARADATFRGATDGLVVVDGAAVIRDANDAVCVLLGVPTTVVIGRPLVEFEAANAQAEVPAWWARLGEAGALSVETALRSAHRGAIPVEASVTRLSRTTGDVLVAFRDITDRRRHEAERERLEAELRQSQKLEAIGTLAGGIAHDFNNVLTVITGWTAAARQELPDGHAALAPLDHVAAAATRAQALVRQILTFSQRRDDDRQVVDVGALLDDSLALVRASLPAMIAIRTEVAPALPPVVVDPVQFHQVVINLASNAADAMHGQAGVLTVSARAESSQVVIAVADTGAGMDAETQRRMFEPFFTTKPVGKGTGLGLSVLHGIVTAHGGTVAVRSAPGQGTAVEVRLPAAPPSGNGTSARPVTAPLAVPRGEGRSVLFVDDEPEVVELMTAQLRRLGFAVTPAASGVEALTSLEKVGGACDAVITDLAMPQMSGLDFASEVRRRYPRIVLGLCSGYLTDADAARARALNFEVVLAKPYSAADLARGISAALAVHRPG